MQTFLISGAGTGIGKATAHSLSSENTKLVLVGRRREVLASLNQELPFAQNNIILAADITNAESLRHAFAEIHLEDLNLTAIIANAGLGGENEYGANDRWAQILDTNLTGTYQFVNEALPALRQSKEKFKHVVIMSSILARLGVPHYSAYCASKAGLLGLMRSWASEWAPENILVNAICPGWVATEMANQGLNTMSQASGKTFDEVHKEQMSFVPLKKMSQPEEVASFIKYLISNEQTSFTGQVFDINNGALMP